MIRATKGHRDVRLRAASREVAVHDRVQVTAKRWDDLPGFEQWLVHARPGSSLHVYLEQFVVTSQAPGPGINCVSRVRGRTLENRPDIVQLYNPGDLHVQIDLKEPESYYVAFFNPAWVKERAVALGFTPVDVSVFRPQVAHPAMVAAFQRLHAAAADDANALARQEALAEAMLSFFENGTEGQAPRVPRRSSRSVLRAKEVLEDRFDQEITLDDLAGEVELTKEHLIRAFHAEFGLPPHQYLIQVRISRARMALAKGASGAAVAAACGFYDQSHLNRCFRRAIGSTPVAYARSVRT